MKQLSRYGRVARNAEMLLVMEPPEATSREVEEARGAIAQDAFDYLTEVLDGVESPYFTTYTRQDARYIDVIAADKVRQSVWDRLGIFEMGQPKLRMTDASEAQAASFAYLAASCMRQVKAPFYQAPALRASVPVPRNLAEFVDTVGTVKDITMAACEAEFHRVVQRNEWRVAFAFWEANRLLAGAMGGIA
ncbi:MAG TPA: hypothetical protein VF157_15545 [Chloroflexota bacterium]